METKPPSKWRKLSLTDILVLIDNVHRGAALPQRVGFCDANETLETLTGRLNKKVWVPVSAVESALWSCNLLTEIGQFRDAVRKRTFDEVLKDILGPGETYHRFYNLIEGKDND
jgi:hypothetical protein